MNCWKDAPSAFICSTSWQTRISKPAIDLKNTVNSKGKLPRKSWISAAYECADKIRPQGSLVATCIASAQNRLYAWVSAVSPHFAEGFVKVVPVSWSPLRHSWHFLYRLHSFKVCCGKFLASHLTASPHWDRFGFSLTSWNFGRRCHAATPQNRSLACCGTCRHVRFSSHPRKKRKYRSSNS